MTTARWMALAGILGLIVAAPGCSKTEDTAPESRVFGSPPVIESVAAGIQVRSIQCDGAQFVLQFWCGFELPPSAFAQPPTVTLDITYSEAILNIAVSDPESTPALSDVLLVSASFLSSIQGIPEETSLVVLDDGALPPKLPFPQKADFSQVCPDPMCSPQSCSPATYEVTSNDATAMDGTYTRRVAFILQGAGVPPGNGFNLLQDCLSSQEEVAPVVSANIVGAPVEFTIEATDRSGNITAWPQRPSLTVQPSSLTCSGDQCGCCFLFNPNPDGTYDPANPYGPGGCRGASGLPGATGSGFENGLCNAI